MKNDLKFRVFGVVLSILFCGGMSCAMSIGAGPSTLFFEDIRRGGYSQKTVTVTTSGAEELDCEIELTGDIGGWVIVDKAPSFRLYPKQREELSVIMRPPSDIDIGTYHGALYIRASPAEMIEDGHAIQVSTGVKIRIIVDITSEDIESYYLKKASIMNAEMGNPVRVQAIVENTGNVLVTPPVFIEVYDSSKSLRMKKSVKDIEIMPSSESELIINLETEGFEIGRYSARLVIGQDEMTLTFGILDRGSLALKGSLDSISLNKIWVGVGETAKITGSVRNTGDKKIEGARLNLEVYLIDEAYQTERLVEAFSSKEVLDIPIGQEAEINAYYQPSQGGRYKIYGYLTHSGKKTPPRSSILNVYPSQKDYSPIFLGIGILMLVVIYWISRNDKGGKEQGFQKKWGDYLQIKT